MNGLNLSDRYRLADRQQEFLEDFHGITPQGYTITAASGTLAQGTTGTELSITTQAADNAIGYVLGTAKHAILAANKPLTFKARFKFAEAATNAANIWLGFTSSAAAAVMGDNGAGPAASYSGFGIYKKDGGLNWWAHCSNAAVQQNVELLAASSLNKVAQVAGSSSFQTVEIDVIPKTATLCDVVFIINGSTVYKMLDVVYTSIAAMAPCALVKAGSGTAEVLLLDYIAWATTRG